MRAADASTFVAELLLASACHGWASLVALDPELAFGALLELRPSCEIDKGLVLWVEPLVAAILLAAHALVILAPAFEAVVLAAALAVELGNAPFHMFTSGLIIDTPNDAQRIKCARTCI